VKKGVVINMCKKGLVKLGIISILLMLSFSGCDKKEEKKLTQFAELEQGDFIAEIIVKDYGTMKIKLFPEQAPKAVENFITHSKEGYYDNLTFHRILEDFMIQGGDPEGTGAGGESIWEEPFEDEFSDDLYPYRGALCMANSGSNTNGSQFFVVQADEAEVKRIQDLVKERYKLSMIDYVLQAYATTITQEEFDGFLTYGGTPWLIKHHTVFGQLIEGFDVLDAIGAVKLADASGIPETAVVIETIQITEYQGD
jgi:peptidyl-prolyl cis-trans isomerase B (cyclophilin B)